MVFLHWESKKERGPKKLMFKTGRRKKFKRWLDRGMDRYVIKQAE